MKKLENVLWMALGASFISVPAQTKESSTRKYVLASTLKIRQAPSSTAKVLGRLRINYPVTVLGQEKEFARVRVLNGTEGWIGKDFLGPNRLDINSVLQRAASLKDPKEQLTWLQRAAAIEPKNVEVLKRLKKAYRNTKNKRAARMVQGHLNNLKIKWLPMAVSRYFEVMRPEKEAREVWVEWKAVMDHLLKPGILKPSQWAELGIKPSDQFWVLMSEGVAVKAKPVAVRGKIWNSCGEIAGYEIKLDVKHRPGVHPLIAVRGKPPESWSHPPVASRLSKQKIKTLARRYARKRGISKKAKLSVAAHGKGGMAVLVEKVPDDNSVSGEASKVTQVAFDARGKRINVRRWKNDSANPHLLLGYRDVTGNGELDEVSTDSCSVYVKLPNGTELVPSSSRCCGC